MEKNILKKFNPALLIHAVFIIIILACAVWVYSGMDERPFTRMETQLQKEHSMMDMNHGLLSGSTTPPPSEGAVTSRDDAVRGYLDAALILAEVYKFNNNGSYAGLCEHSEDLYTLEGESGGILKYIKFVGATEVFCTTGSDTYMIEAKMPENGMFYCIDEQGIAVEQDVTREEVHSCT